MWNNNNNIDLTLSLLTVKLFSHICVIYFLANIIKVHKINVTNSCKIVFKTLFNHGIIIVIV